MAKIFEHIDAHMADWIAAQRLFFVASAPLDPEGHVNLSPKGPIETLRVLDEHTVAYLDMVGSGAETAAHVRENGRIVIMFCAFQGPPRIVRLHGRAEFLPAGDARFQELLERCAFTEVGFEPARRAIVLVDVLRIADACGYGVPLMGYEGQRPHSELWAQKKLRVEGEQALLDYQREKNAVSIDGLAAIEVPGVAGGS